MTRIADTWGVKVQFPGDEDESGNQDEASNAEESSEEDGDEEEESVTEGRPRRAAKRVRYT
jgi:hypothetical protein